MENRTCTRCGESHPITFFNRDRTKPDGIYPHCKNCSRKACRESYEAHLEAHRALKQAWKDANRERHREMSTARRQTHLDDYRRSTAKWNDARRAATPPWADKKAIRDFYKQRPPGHHVDHIEPLQGRDRCGLNVIWNLQYLPADLSRKKGNWTEAREYYSGRVSSATP